MLVSDWQANPCPNTPDHLRGTGGMGKMSGAARFSAMEPVTEGRPNVSRNDSARPVAGGGALLFVARNRHAA